MGRKKADDIHIKKSREGSLRRIARRRGGLRKDGKISRVWARAELVKAKCRKDTKLVRKLVFFLNFTR